MCFFAQKNPPVFYSLKFREILVMDSQPLPVLQNRSLTTTVPVICDLNQFFWFDNACWVFHQGNFCKICVTLIKICVTLIYWWNLYKTVGTLLWKLVERNFIKPVELLYNQWNLGFINKLFFWKSSTGFIKVPPVKLFKNGTI